MRRNNSTKYDKLKVNELKEMMQDLDWSKKKLY